MKTKELPIQIGIDERKTKGLEASKKRHDAHLKREELKKLSKPLKEKIEELEDEAAKLEEAAATGVLLAPVEVREEKDFSTNTLRVIRCDTEEIVEERAMTGAERRQETVVDDGADKIEVPPEAPKKKRGRPPKAAAEATH